MHQWRINVLVSMVANVLINAALFLDIYLIIRNPFFPRSKRETIYYSVIAVIVFIHFVITTNFVAFHSNGILLMNFEKGIWFVDYQRYLIAIIFIVTLLIAIAILFRLRF